MGVLGSVGLGLLFYTVILLMQKIEGTFNFIWLVPQERPFAQRFSDYLSVIVIGPVLVFSSLGVSASLQSTTIVKTITAIEPFGSLIHIGGAVLPFVLVIAAFTFVYVFIPNTRVKSASVFAGAVVSGLLWNFTSVLFAKFVVSSTQYTEIYAAFATLIIFMLWLYVGWLVLLLDLSVEFYYQNPERVTLARGDATLSLRLVERLAFAFLTEIANQFTTADPQTKLEDLAGKVGAPARLTERQIKALARAGLVVVTAGSPERWMPARAPDTISLSEIMAAIRSDGETPALAFDRIAIPPAPDRLLSDIEQRQNDVLSKLLLADLVDPEEDAPSPEISVSMLRVKREPGDAAEQPVRRNFL